MAILKLILFRKSIKEHQCKNCEKTIHKGEENYYLVTTLPKETPRNTVLQERYCSRCKKKALARLSFLRKAMYKLPNLR